MDFVSRLQQHDAPSALQAALSSISEGPRRTKRFKINLDPEKDTIVWYPELVAGENSNGALGMANGNLNGAGNGDPFLDHLAAVNGAAVGEHNALIPGRRKRRKKEEDEYDVEDPFIDNADNIYEEVGFAKPTTDKEFFVFEGRFELEEQKGRKKAKKKVDGDSTKKKTKKTSSSLADALSGKKKKTKKGEKKEAKGKATPPKKGVKKKPVLTEEEKAAREAERIAKLQPIRPVSASVQAKLEALKEAASKESFSVKSKFPAELRPLVLEAAKEAQKCNQLDENYYNILPTLLPYNRFTLRKLTKRLIFPDRIEELTAEKHVHMARFKQQVEDAMRPQLEEYEAEVAKLEKEKLEKGDVPAENADTVMAEQAATVQPKAEPEAIAEEALRSSPAAESDHPEPPFEKPKEGEVVKKFKWSEELRVTLYHIIQAEMEMTTLKNEKIELEKAGEKLSEQTMRKVVYAEIIKYWPEDWLTTYLISREYSMHKRKMDKREEKLKFEVSRQAVVDHAVSSTLQSSPTRMDIDAPKKSSLHDLLDGAAT